MKDIVKNLKFGTFLYNPEKNEFWLNVVDSKTGVSYSATLNKVYAFAFMRFLIRVAQRNWLRKKVRTNAKR